MRITAIIMLCVMSTGCLSGDFVQSSPTVTKQGPAQVTINAPLNEVWRRFIPELSKSFFVINNIDKESGFINVSYSGDPEKYVDGGTITSWVKNGRGRRDYTFPATKSYQEYEYTENGNLYTMKRQVDLEGRINITMIEPEPSKTSVTVNAKYILRKSGDASWVSYDGNLNQMNNRQPFDLTISFSSGDGGKSFPGQMGVFRPTGELEREILVMLEALPQVEATP